MLQRIVKGPRTCRVQKVRPSSVCRKVSLKSHLSTHGDALDGRWRRCGGRGLPQGEGSFPPLWLSLYLSDS